MSLDVEPQVITTYDYHKHRHEVYAKATFGNHVFMTPIFTVKDGRLLANTRLKAALSLANSIGRSLSQE